MLAEEVEESKFREFRESIILVLQRSAVNPRRDIRWERIQILLCVLGIAISAALASYVAAIWAPAGAVVTNKAEDATPWQSFNAFLLVSVASSLMGLALERRRFIYRITIGRVKPREYEKFHYNFAVSYLFHEYLPFAVLQFSGAGFLIIQSQYERWPYGWITVAIIGLVVGYVLGKWTWTLWVWVIGITGPDSEQPLDCAVESLFAVTTLLYSCLRDGTYSLRSVRRYVRLQLFVWATVVEHNDMPLRLLHRAERGLRSEIKMKHARIAQAIRVHAGKLATVQNEGQYREISSSLLGGLLAALEGDIETLMETCPEVSRSSKVRNFLRHVTPALVMVIFAAIIPFLPGVGDAAGSVRVLLLATAVLTLIPGASSARPAIEGALSKALPGQQKP
ncbi:hypothetical protein [Streptomyces sp. NBC_00401]|uniref:hypothetical protein n=1 Tax=Streptomyces sp. NBC_00401 TaxID=2975738 RepID=UPI002254F395|nr:hypothetical protein [Streptomyces sp. NBC_00401]